MLTGVLVVFVVLRPCPLPGRFSGALVVDVARLLEGEDRRSFSVKLWFYPVSSVFSFSYEMV
jgi:hypothetical protein